MALPPLAPVPPAAVRIQLPPQEWETYLDSFLTLTTLYLRLPAEQLAGNSGSQNSLVVFLTSFHKEDAHREPRDTAFDSITAKKLRKTCFSLIRDIWMTSDPPDQLLDFEFLASFCRVHAKTVALRYLMVDLFKQHEKRLNKTIIKWKTNLINRLDSSSHSNNANSDLSQFADVMLSSTDAAVSLMSGADFLDALASSYPKSNARDHRKVTTAAAYLGLLSLTEINPPNISWLTDCLYNLKTQADQNPTNPSLLADLVTNTSLIPKLRRNADGISAERLLKCLNLLETYRSPSIAVPRKHKPRTKDKSKGKAIDLRKDSEMHMYHMSLVTQIQDLFPDLGSGFVLKLLEEYSGDVEQITAHLLDDSLPTHLRDLDRTQEVVFESSQDQLERLEPRSTPPPTEPEPFIPDRRNVFDDDEFDRLELDTSRLHIGKQNKQLDPPTTNKAAILSALAAFDSDDDERDDTYDVDDVGGTVDTAHPDGEPGPSAKVTQEQNDAALFTAYKSAPELFGRTFDIRKGQARQALKSETGMTDEAIEGWAIMLQRDPKRLGRLEAQFGTFDGKQAELASTAYRESPGGTDTDDSDVQHASPRGGFGGRSRGRGRGGPSSDPNSTSAHRHKEANKGSRANHNRRNQRAKKMARGGFAG